MKETMKCISLFVFLCISLMGYAKKEYLPMLKDGRQWNLVDVYQKGIGEYHYRIDGTEAVDGKECFLTYASGYEIQEHGCTISKGSGGPYYLSEKDGKINYMFGEISRDVIDLTLDTGTSIPGKVMVLSIDTIPVFGIPYRCIRFGIWNYWGEPLYWIEGIGSTWNGPFGDRFDSGHEIPGSYYGTRLLSVFDGDKCIFDIDEFNKSRLATRVKECNDSPQPYESSSAIFDLQGRRLTQKPAKGVYIQDGKKVVVK